MRYSRLETTDEYRRKHSTDSDAPHNSDIVHNASYPLHLQRSGGSIHTETDESSSNEPQDWRLEPISPVSPLLSHFESDDHINTRLIERRDSITTTQEPSNEETPAPRRSEESVVSNTKESTFQRPSEQAPAAWLPYTLRWWYMSLLSGFNGVLLIVVIVLFVQSRRDDGLATDDGSKSILFGWRFMPTLLAVLYSQMTMMLFEDVKRTEPFALLSCPGGAKASSTLLQHSPPWWGVFKSALAKNDNRRSWALFCACFVYVLGFLAISPLSSAMLMPADTAIHHTVDFSRIVPTQGRAISLQPREDTYFRTISNLLQNVTTSAWLSGPYYILPSWPTTISSVPLGSILATKAQTWQTQSFVYEVEYACQNAQISDYRNSTIVADKIYNYQYPIALELTSANGCVYLVDLPLPKQTDLFEQGGVLWSNLRGSGLFPDSPSSITNQAAPCGEEVDFILISSPWQLSKYNGSKGYSEDGAFKLAQNTTISAQICASKFYQAEVPLSMAVSPSITQIEFNVTAFKEIRAGIPKSIVNDTELREFILHPRWSNYLSKTLRNAEKTAFLSKNRPAFDGAAAALGAFYDWNLTTMIAADDVTERARQIQKRLFGELMQSSMERRGASDTRKQAGIVIQVERRIIVITGVAVALMCLLILSGGMITFVNWRSRLRYRPLNLRQDPGTAIGIASLIPEDHVETTFSNLSLASKKEMARLFANEPISLGANGALQGAKVQERVSSTFPKNWHPTSFRKWALLVMLSYILALIIGIAVLYHFSSQSKLYQTAFVYQPTIKIIKSVNFAPYSMIPTILAICLSLWWEAIDKTLRRLQPYLAMSRRSAPIAKSSGLSYNSCYLLWAAFKAASNRHWILSMVNVGSITCQILVISMSALFEREPGVIHHSLQATRLLEPRQIPFVHTDTYNRVVFGDERGVPGRILANTFANAQTSWIYSATIQLAMDGLEPPWSKDGWSFLPVSLSALPESSNATLIQDVGEPNFDPIHTSSMANFTMKTLATRARLKCDPIPEVSNTTSWLETVQFRKFANATAGPVTNVTVYDPTDMMFGQFYTSLMAHPGRVSCCLNTSLPDDASPVAIGYWSANDKIYRWPFPSSDWPRNLTVKWMRGPATTWPTDIDVLTTTPYQRKHSKLMFTELPQLQALNCQPSIESAEAEVTVDYLSGNVQDFQILSDVQPATEAWSDPFVVRKQSYRDPTQVGHDMFIDVNITTSYGVLFMSALLGASDLAQIQGTRNSNFLSQRRKRAQDELFDTGNFGDEDFLGVDDTFKIRDNSSGLNMDLMSYTMFTLADRDPEALLNATIMEKYAQKTFSTFFQHFVSMNIQPDRSLGAYQDIGDDSLQEILSSNMTDMIYEDREWKPTYQYRKMNTSRTVDGMVSTKIELLRINQAAAWISILCLVWLFFTCLSVIARHKRYLRPLIRDIGSLADVLVLVTGNGSLLNLVREMNSKELTKNTQLLTRLGWLRGNDGSERWGIEVVNYYGLNAMK